MSFDGAALRLAMVKNWHGSSSTNYMGLLSCLLIHYTLDGFLFTVSNARRASIETFPFATPAVA